MSDDLTKLTKTKHGGRCFKLDKLVSIKVLSTWHNGYQRVTW